MRLKNAIVVFLVALMSACSSTGSSGVNKPLVLENVKTYSYQSLTVPNSQEATPYDYVFFAAKKADRKKYPKFALVHEYVKDKNGIFRFDTYRVFMFHSSSDLVELKRYEKPTKNWRY